MQSILARRIARAAWQLERAERIEVELFEEHRGPGGVGLAVIRDGNGTRSFETRWPEAAPTSGGRCAPTNRYCGAAMAEFMRALRTLKALQAEQAARPMGASTPRPEIARRPEPNQPERGAERRLEYGLPSHPRPAAPSTSPRRLAAEGTRAAPESEPTRGRSEPARSRGRLESERTCSCASVA